MNQKGFANIALLIVLLVVVGVGAGYVVLTRTQEPISEQAPTPSPTTTQTPTPQTQSPVSVDETSNLKTYSDSHFSVRYPEDYDFVFNLCLKDCASQSTEGSSNSSISIEAEKEGGGCFLGLCNASVKKHQTINGVAWDYLGLQGYGDVGESSSFYAYRTTHGGYHYHVLFNKDLPTNEAIMQTFKFGSTQLPSISFLSPNSGDVLKQGLWHKVRFSRAIGFWPEDVSGKLMLVRGDGSVVGEVFNDFRDATVSIGVESAGTIDNLVKITTGRYKLRLVTNDSNQKLLAESGVFVVQE